MHGQQLRKIATDGATIKMTMMTVQTETQLLPSSRFDIVDQSARNVTNEDFSVICSHSEV